MSRRRREPVRRIVVEQQRGHYSALGYTSARAAVHEGRTPTQGSAPYHQHAHREALVTQAREFARNNGIFRGMIERAAAYIVGNGYDLQATTKSKAWNREAERLWRSYWKRPEVKQILSGRRLERMVATELLTVGEAIALKTTEAREVGGAMLPLLQALEAEQIKAPRRTTNPDHDGIEKTASGKPTHFYVCPWASGQVKTDKAEKTAAQHVLFVSDPERPSAVRSVPPCQASFPMLHRINDVCDSEAIAWQMLARVALSITRKDGQGGLPPESGDEDPGKASGGAQNDDDLTTRLVELDYALIFAGEPGEEVKGIERNVPGKNFSETLIMFLRLLGLPLGLPLEVILLDWTKSNYSQTRAVLEQAFTTFRGWQLLLIDLFHSRAYEWFIDSCIAAGLLTDRQDKHDHDWIVPTFPWIDQLKEAEAYGEQLDRGFRTYGFVCKALNSDRESVIETRKREVEEAIEIAQAIKKKTGVDVPWQIFAGLKPDAAPKPPAAEPEREAA